MSTKNVSRKSLKPKKQESNRPFEPSLSAVAKRRGEAIVLSSTGMHFFAGLTSARAIRHLVGLSLGDVAQRVRQTTGHLYSTGAIANMEKPTRYRRNVNGSRRVLYPMPAEVQQVYTDALNERMIDLYDGDLRLEVRVYQAGWRVTPQVKCKVCKDWYTPQRGNVSRCDWCASHNQTKRRKVFDPRELGGVL